MNVFQQVALAWQAFSRTLLQLASARLWIPVLALAAIQFGVVLAVWNFAHPSVSWAMVPLLRRMAGEGVLHYPNALHALPVLLRQFDLWIGVTAGPFLWGAATLLFAERFQRGTPNPGVALRQAAKRSPWLALSQVPVVALALAASFAFALALRPGPGGLRAMLFTVAVACATAVVQAMFLYLPAVIVLEERNAVQAWAELPRTWQRGLGSALFLVTLVGLGFAGLDRLWSYGPSLEARFGPESMVLLAGARIALGSILWLLLWGGATLAYLGVVMEFDEWDV